MSGEELKDIRLKLKLTQAELAAKVGVNLRSLQYWEKNERKVPETTAYFINDLLKNEQSPHDFSSDLSIKSLNKNKIKESEELLNDIDILISEIENIKTTDAFTEKLRLFKLKHEAQDFLDKLKR